MTFVAGQTLTAAQLNDLDIDSLVVDTDVLVVDKTNDRVGVNDATPSYALDVTGDINATGDLRIGGTAIGTWQTWTPTLYNFTVGSYNAGYTTVDNLVFVYFESSDVTGVTGNMELSLPFTASTGTRAIGSMGGTAFAYDVNLGDPHWGRPDTTTAGTRIRFWNMITTSISIFNSGTPFTWASGDDFRFTAWYEK